MAALQALEAGYQVALMAPTEILAEQHFINFKRWLYLIPLIFITYSLAYLDRANYGFASAAGSFGQFAMLPGTLGLVRTGISVCSTGWSTRSTARAVVSRIRIAGTSRLT